jgi:hypothetical protein
MSQRSESTICRKAYESIDPLTRYDAKDNIEKPRTPLYYLENMYKKDDKCELFSRKILEKYLNVNDPFMLLTHNPQTKLSKEKLRQASECILGMYYDQLRMSCRPKVIEELREKSTIISENNFDKRYNINRGYLEFDGVKKSFETFISNFMNGSELNVVNDEIKKHCSSLLNPEDVFFPCTENCVDGSRSASPKNVTQPRLMQEELTKFDNTLRTMYKYLMENIEKTKIELKSELTASNVRPKIIKKILDDKFGGITYVPSLKADSREDEENEMTSEENSEKVVKRKPENSKVRKARETQKKRRQKLQQMLIKTVLDNKGKIYPKYRKLFSLEVPFDLTDKGKVISKRGGLKTAYDKIDKRIQLQLRFKGNQALKNTMNLLKGKGKEGDTNDKNLSNKIALLKEIVNKPHADKPLKLVRSEEGKMTVARGGDYAMREIISLFGIKEFKDKLDGMKQKYALTEKTEDLLGDIVRDDEGFLHPVVDDFKYFEFKDLGKNIESLFLKFLYNKLKFLKKDQEFRIGELRKYEKIDIPFVKEYRLEYKKNEYIFTPHLGDAFIVVSVESRNYESQPSLTYEMNIPLIWGAYLPYDEAVRLARKHIRSSPENILQKNDIARFYLRNEDKHRMEPIENILKVLNLHNKIKAKDPKPSLSKSASKNVSKSASNNVSNSASDNVSKSASNKVSKSASNNVSKSASNKVSNSANKTDKNKKKELDTIIEWLTNTK